MLVLGVLGGVMQKAKLYWSQPLGDHADLVAVAEYVNLVQTAAIQKETSLFLTEQSLVSLKMPAEQDEHHQFWRDGN